jgi:hypothetical protein
MASMALAALILAYRMTSGILKLNPVSEESEGAYRSHAVSRDDNI